MLELRTQTRLQGNRVHLEPLEFKLMEATSPERMLAAPPGQRQIVAMSKSPVVHFDPEILRGTVVSRGTRVPLQNLNNYLEDRYPLEEVLQDFPPTTRRQANEGSGEARAVLTKATA
jgi:uncharacterized protein (DUF433 family)